MSRESIRARTDKAIALRGYLWGEALKEYAESAKQDILALLAVADAAAALHEVHTNTANTVADGASTFEALTDALAQRTRAWADLLISLDRLEALP